MDLKGQSNASSLTTHSAGATGGKIELVDSQLPVGTPVEVIVLLPQPVADSRRSILDVLADAPGHLAFETAEDVDTYLRAERDAGER